MAIHVNQWVSDCLKRASTPVIATLSIGLTAIVGVLDYFSGPDVSLSIFYVLPIAVAAWWGNRMLAVLIAAFAPFVSYAAETAIPQGATDLWVSVWNGSIRLSMLVLIALLLSHFRATADKDAELALRDSLTGLFNPRAFYSLIEDEMARARRYHHMFSIAYIDVDDFKQVNDQYGHIAGDQLLVHASRVMRESCRVTDVVGRLGGDEFAILMPETDGRGASDAIHHLRGKLTKSMKDFAWPATVSIGVTTFPPEQLTVTEILRATDDAMYAVKRSGKNGWEQRIWANDSSSPYSC